MNLLFGLATTEAEIPNYPSSVTAFDPREVALLPRWCIYTQMFRDAVPGGNNPDEIKHWYTVMGDHFHHMHHYCLGLMKTNRAIILARDQIDKQFYLADSIHEFDYVMRSAPPGFVLTPEILTKRGENQLRLGRTTQGVADLRRAIEIKPDYWPPYESLSDFYRGAGEVAKAREVLEQAISYSPEAKGLQRRLAELREENKRKPATSANQASRIKP